MSRLRDLFRAARELYLDCVRERRLAESHLGSDAAPLVQQALEARADSARRREDALRDASRTLVHHIHATDETPS